MIKTTWGNSLTQLGFMELNGKARDRRRGNEICSQVRGLQSRDPSENKRKRKKKRDKRGERGWTVRGDQSRFCANCDGGKMENRRGTRIP